MKSVWKSLWEWLDAWKQTPSHIFVLAVLFIVIIWQRILIVMIQ